MRTVWPILWKEALHIARDPRSLLASLALPLLLLVLFGAAIRFDVTDVAVVVVDQDRSAASRELVARLTAGDTVRVIAHEDDPEAIEAHFEGRRARLGLVIPPGYAAGTARGRAVPVQLLVDGTDAAFAGQALGIVSGIVGDVTLREARASGSAPDAAPGLVARPRVWFNEALDGTWFVVPGLIAVIVSVLAAMVTSQCVAREFEQDTIEQILVSPVSGPAFMVGKLLPYVGIGVAQVLTVLLASRFVFGVPIRGSLLLLGLGTLLYLTGSMALGLMLSAVLRSQQVALQVSILVGMLPSLLLSGFIFPIHNMPTPLQAVTYVVPARYFVAIARALFLKDAGLEAIATQMVAMTVFAGVMLLVAVSRFPRRLA